MNDACRTTIRTFYAMVLEGNGTPPSTGEVAARANINKSTAYEHLRKGVEDGLIKYEMVPGSHYGVKGFRTFHPATTIGGSS